MKIKFCRNLSYIFCHVTISVKNQEIHSPSKIFREINLFFNSGMFFPVRESSRFFPPQYYVLWLSEILRDINSCNSFLFVNYLILLDGFSRNVCSLMLTWNNFVNEFRSWYIIYCFNGKMIIFFRQITRRSFKIVGFTKFFAVL